MKSLAIVALLCLAGKSFAANPPTPNVGTNRNPANYDNLVFYGANVYRAETSSTTLLATGSGILFGASCTAGQQGNTVTAGDYGLLMDTSVLGGTTLASTGIAISPEVNSPEAVNSTLSSNSGTWTPPGGSVRFTKGLVMVKNNTSAVSCLAYAILDSQTSGSTH